MADEANLVACALTDHDTVAGVPEFLAEGEKYPNLKLYSGVEISSRHNYREIHIVGLGVDHTNGELLEFLDKMRQDRIVRAETMAEKLANKGYPLPDSWRKLDVVGRMHFAELLKEHYNFSTISEVFEKLLRRGMPGYVPRILPAPDSVIKVIHAAGGVAIWAHPVYSQQRERAWAKKVLKHLAPAGLDGMEGFYSGFTAEQMLIVRNLTEEFKLFRSGGSDFHGAGHTGVAVGVGYGELKVPDELLHDIDEKLKLYREGKDE